MADSATIDAYNASLTADDRAIALQLREAIDTALPDATSKVWHAHPVWFLNGNPVVGYSQRKDGIGLLFWSGQDFDAPGLRASGKFKAAEARFATPEDIDPPTLVRCLEQARAVQWDYKNIVKRRGVLERIA